MRIPTTLTALLLLSQTALGQGLAPCCVEFDHSHALLGKVLAQHVKADRFDYAALKKEPRHLDLYLDAIEAVTSEHFTQWSRDQRYAFWINVYNAYTLKAVVERYPVKSIKDIGSAEESVWDRAFIPLGELHPKRPRKLSLNQVEHEILRPEFEDARVHAAVNCASVGCPPLRAEAFDAAKLEAQLDEQARLWLADAKRNRFDQEAGTLQVSKIFDWFKDDFVRDADSVLGWLAEYGPKDVARWLRTEPKVKVRYIDYDWALNDIERNR